MVRTCSRRTLLVSVGTSLAGATLLSACGGSGAVSASTGSSAASSSFAGTTASSTGTTTASATTTVATATRSSLGSTSSAAAPTAMPVHTTATATHAAVTTSAAPGMALKVPPGATHKIRLSAWSLTWANAAVYNAYMAQNPDTAIQFDQVAGFGQYFTKIQAQIASGDAPDVMTMSPYYHVVFAARKVTRPLDDLVARDKVDLGQLYAPLVASGRWAPGRIATGAGKLYVMPMALNSGTFYYYNKALFQQHGITPPDVTWTWDTMRETARKLTIASGGGTTQQWGLGNPWDGNQRINSWIWQAGGQFYDPQFTKCTLRSDGKAYDAFSYLVDMVQKDKVAAPPGQGGIKGFTTNKLAMTPGGSWWSQYIVQAKVTSLDWDVFLPPKNPQTGSRVIDAYTNGLAISTTSKETDAAWKYLQWFTMGEGLPLEVAHFTGFVPAHIATAERYVFTANRTTPPHSLSIYSDLLKQGHAIFVAAGEGDIGNAIDKYQTPAFAGKTSVDAAATTIQQQVTSILQQQRSELGITG